MRYEPHRLVGWILLALGSLFGACGHWWTAGALALLSGVYLTSGYRIGAILGVRLPWVTNDA